MGPGGRPGLTRCTDVRIWDYPLRLGRRTPRAYGSVATDGPCECTTRIRELIGEDEWLVGGRELSRETCLTSRVSRFRRQARVGPLWTHLHQLQTGAEAWALPVGARDARRVRRSRRSGNGKGRIRIRKEGGERSARRADQNKPTESRGRGGGRDGETRLMVRHEARTKNSRRQGCVEECAMGPSPPTHGNANF